MYLPLYPLKQAVARASSRARLLWMVHARPGISRAELAEASALSKAAISAVVADLLGKGMLLERQTAPSSVGRRRIGLQLNDRAGLALGVHIEATQCTAVLTDLAGQPIQLRSYLGEMLAPSDAVREGAALVRELAAAAPTDVPIVGLGVSVAGLADAAGESVLLFAPQAWAGELPLALLLREQLGWADELPLVLINGYHAAALAEHRSGAGQGADDMFFVSVGEGIGAGFVLDGELYPGSSGGAGDIAHIAVDPAGVACSCGNIGCLETLASGPAVIRSVEAALKEHGRDHLLGHSQPGSGSIRLEDVIRATVAGDMVALAAVRQAGEYLGTAIAGLVNALNPRRVVIGGQLAEAGDTLLTPLQEALLRRAAPAAYSNVQVRPAALGNDAAALGAAALAIERYLLAYV
ncbi:MAG: ROK family transcriptional regulator [Thermoflexales bacterium]|nr:ROK family transcriptional regulator [Thermoflexales bacterium]